MASDDVMATCVTEQWSFNSRNQSPCVVGSALAGVCVGGDFTLTALEPDFVYLGPSESSATPCRCNSVYYSMLSACAACQDRSFIRWSRYSANCTTVYVEVYPQPLPVGVSVPAWAYLDVESQDIFNITLARAATGPESTAVPAPTSTSSISRATGTTVIGASSSTPTSPVGGTTVSEKKSNAGAIAGGVVGGIVFLALLALLLFFLRRRNKAKKTPPSALYSGAPLNSPSSPAPMSYGDGSSTYPSIPSPKPYDPKDPATFPYNGNQPYTPPPQNVQYPNNTSPNYGNGYAPAPQSPNYLPSNVTGQSANSGYTQPNTLVNQPRYTGAPEL